MWSLQQNQLISNQSKGVTCFSENVYLERSWKVVTVKSLRFQQLPQSSRLFSQGWFFHGVRRLLVDPNKATNMVAAQWMISMFGISSGQASPPIFGGCDCWFGVEFPVGLFLFLSNNALHSNWPKQTLVLSHWLNSRAPFMVYPSPPFKFKGWKHSICVFVWGPLESICPVELRWNFHLSWTWEMWYPPAKWFLLHLSG